MEAFTQRVDIEDENGDSNLKLSEAGNHYAYLLPPNVIEQMAHDQISHDQSQEVSTGVELLLLQKRLPLFGGPEFLQRLNVFEEVILGDSVSFECRYKAFPIPISKWFKDDVQLDENERIQISNRLETVGTLRLIINNVKKSDEGAYRCKLENQEGVAATTGYLSVTGSTTPKSDNAVTSAALSRAITEEQDWSTSQETKEKEIDDEKTASLEDILLNSNNITWTDYTHYMDLLTDNSNLASVADTEITTGAKTRMKKTEIVDIINTDLNDSSHPITLKTSELESTIIHGKENYIKCLDSIALSKVTELSLNERDLNHSTSSGDYKHNVSSKMEEDKVIIDEGKRDFIHDNNEDELERDPRVYFYTKETLMSGDCTEFEMSTKGLIDENKLKETVIAGRIGMPSDWEFVHYAADVYENRSDLKSVLGYVNKDGVAIATPLQTEEEEGRKIDSYEHLEEGHGRKGENFLEAEMEGTYEVESSEDKGEILMQIVACFHHDLLAGSTPSEEVLAENIPISEAEKFKARDKAENVRVSKEGESPVMIKGKSLFLLSDNTAYDNCTKSKKVETESSNSHQSVTGLESSVVGWITKSMTTEKVLAEIVQENLENCSKETSSNDETKSNFIEDFVSNVKPSLISCISDWIPEASYLLDITSSTADWVAKPAELEDAVPQITPEFEEEFSRLEWCTDWFKFPWLFFLLLAFGATLIASAMEMNPAWIIIIVSILSFLGFHFLPVDVD